MQSEPRTDARTESKLESVEPRLMMSSGRGAAVAGALASDSYRLIIGDSVITGTMTGKQLVIHTAAGNTIGGTGIDEVIRIGSTTIGGSVGDPIILQMAGNTIGGVMTDDGMLLRLAGNTIGGATNPDTWIVRFNTVGGTTNLDATIRVGANTVGGILSPESPG